MNALDFALIVLLQIRINDLYLYDLYENVKDNYVDKAQVP